MDQTEVDDVGFANAVRWIFAPLLIGALVVSVIDRPISGIAFFFGLIWPQLLAVGIAAHQRKDLGAKANPRWRWRIVTGAVVGVAVGIALGYPTLAIAFIGWTAGLYVGLLAFVWKAFRADGKSIAYIATVYLASAAILTGIGYVLPMLHSDDEECREVGRYLEVCR